MSSSYQSCCCGVEKMDNKNFFENYQKFVDSVTSDYVKDDINLQKQTEELSKNLSGKFARMDNAVSGIAGEAGEIADLWKKVKFHGKEFNSDIKEEMIKELGDMFWYLAQASMALDIPMEDIINKNIEKLSLRHPNKFDSGYMKK